MSDDIVTRLRTPDPLLVEAAEEIASLREQVDAARALRVTMSVDEQTTRGALATLWRILGANNQTYAASRIKRLLAIEKQWLDHINKEGA